MDDKQRIEIEAATFRALAKHLRTRSDVQNIDMMNLTGFCRNCLSKWYSAAAQGIDINIDYEEAREVVYGIPYLEWKAKHQTAVSKDKLETFQEIASQKDG